MYNNARVNTSMNVYVSGFHVLYAQENVKPITKKEKEKTNQQ